MNLALMAAASSADAHELAGYLRPEDKRELEDLSGRTALRSLLLGVLCSAPATTFRTPSGALGGIVGVVPGKAPRQGTIWMAATREIENLSVTFLRHSRQYLDDLGTTYEVLGNVCDARNEVHIRWLRWLGFAFIRKIDRFGPNGVPVYEFAKLSPSRKP